MVKIKQREFFIESDVLIEHLNSEDDKSTILELAMTKGICFTSVLNASELYFSANNDEQKKYIDILLRSLKILGLNSRYSLSIDRFKNKVNNVRDALVCVIAEINNLEIITFKFSNFENTGLTVINALNLRGKFDTW